MQCVLQGTCCHPLPSPGDWAFVRIKAVTAEKGKHWTNDSVVCMLFFYFLILNFVTDSQQYLSTNLEWNRVVPWD